MTRSLKSAAATTLVLMTAMGGCAAARRPLVLIRPQYSYYRDGGSLADAGDAAATPTTRSIMADYAKDGLAGGAFSRMADRRTFWRDEPAPYLAQPAR